MGKRGDSITAPLAPESPSKVPLLWGTVLTGKKGLVYFWLPIMFGLENTDRNQTYGCQ